MSLTESVAAELLVTAVIACAIYAAHRGERGIAVAFLIEAAMVTVLAFLLRAGAF